MYGVCWLPYTIVKLVPREGGRETERGRRGERGEREEGGEGGGEKGGERAREEGERGRGRLYEVFWLPRVD